MDPVRTAVVGLKPGLNHTPLISLATRYLPPGSQLHLVSLIVLRKGEEAVARLRSERDRIGRTSNELEGSDYLVSTQVEVTTDAVGNQLAETAHRVRAELLILGLAKRTRVGKALLGSDAQLALILSPCPVLAVRID